MSILCVYLLTVVEPNVYVIRSETYNMYVHVEWLFKSGELVRNHLVLKFCDFLKDAYMSI